MNTIKHPTNEMAEARHATQGVPGDRGAAQPQVGERLRALRKERGLSLGQLSEETGISTSFLSLVEKGRSDITLGRLMRIVRLYGIRLSALLPEPPAADPRIVRSYERKRLSSPGEGIDVFLLARDTERVMMPIISVFEPGGANTEHSAHEGEEFVHVLEGAISIELEGDEPIILREGDSAYYRADRPHLMRNIVEGNTRLLEVLSPPTF